VVFNAQGVPVASGTTATNETTKRPKFKVSLPPGTYNIVTSWVDGQGTTHGGQQTYTVTRGENIPNVVVDKDGHQNPPAQGTNPKPVGKVALGATDQASAPIFADGFESGNTSAWSSTGP